MCVANRGILLPILYDQRIQNGIPTERKRFTTKSDYDLRAENLVENRVNKKLQFNRTTAASI